MSLLGLRPFQFKNITPLTILQKKDLYATAELLKEDTHWDLNECKLVLLLLWYMTHGKNVMDRSIFSEVLHGIFNMTDNILMDRVFRMFDKDNDGYINQREWLHGLSIFVKGTQKDRVKFSFHVYDLNNDHYLSREEIYTLLKGCIVKGYTMSDEEAEEITKEIVEIVARRMDFDRDGRISLQDFAEAVADDGLMLYALGQAVANPQDQEVFMGLLDQFRPQL